MLKGIIGALFLAVVCTCLYGQQPDIATFFKEEPSVEVIPGMFTTYRSDGRIYWEVPDSLVGREFAVTTTILTAPARPDRDMEKKFGYSGDMVGPVFFSFRKQGDELWMMDPLHERVVENSGGVYAKIAAQRGDERLYKVLPVKAKNPGSSLIEIGKVLKDFPLFTLDIVSFDLSLSMRLREKDCIKEIKGYNDRLLIHASRTYQSLSMGMPDKPAVLPYIGDWDTGICIKLLSKKPLESVFANNGAYFGISKDYFLGDQPAIRKIAIKRWRLEVRPEDEEKYMKGQLVEPIKPIIFYIDRNTPEKYISCIIEAVRDWCPAFEKAGFKNAIDARLAPTIEEDPDFSMYDSDYPFISWKISGQNNAYGPTPCEPRAGEIIACHIGLFSSVLNLEQQWYFAQCGANDPQAWNIELADTLQYELIKQVLTHEVGHTLGLEHNFLGSSHYSVDQLRDNNFLSQYSIGSSIMDYVRFNYALRPQDKVDLKNRRIRISEYDRWAIEWGYRWLPEFETAEAEIPHMNKWIISKLKEDKRYTFGTESDRDDPRNQNEDLGDDAMLASAYGIKNLKRVMPEIMNWTYEPNEGYGKASALYSNVTGQFYLYMGHVATNVGGIYSTPISVEQTEVKAIEYVPKDVQKKAVAFLNKELFTTPTWLMDNKLTEKTRANTFNQVFRIQSNILKQLISSRTIDKMTANELMNGNKAYTANEMFLDLKKSIWSDLRGGKRPDLAQRGLQKTYVNSLVVMLEKPKNSGTNAVLFAYMSDSPSEAPTIARGQLTDLRRDLTNAANASSGIYRSHYLNLKALIDAAFEVK